MNQLDGPTYIFVDQNYSIYISDRTNDRVMKWDKDATEGVVVAGGQDEGNALTQLDWPQGAKRGTVIAGGNSWGCEANQLRNPVGLSFDRYGNLYVADHMNHRVQRFSIE